MKARLMFGVEPYADLVATETGESHVGGDLSSSLPLQFQRISSSSPGRRSLVSADGSVSADGDPPPPNKSDQSQNEKHYCCWHLYLRSTLFNQPFLCRLPGGVYPQRALYLRARSRPGEPGKGLKNMPSRQMRPDVLLATRIEYHWECLAAKIEACSYHLDSNFLTSRSSDFPSLDEGSLGFHWSLLARTGRGEAAVFLISWAGTAAPSCRWWNEGNVWSWSDTNGATPLARLNEPSFTFLCLSPSAYLQFWRLNNGNRR